MTKVVLINLDTFEAIAPLNLGYLKSYAYTDLDVKKNIDISIHSVFMNQADLYEQILALIAGAKIVGFSYYLWSAETVDRMVQKLKTDFPDLHIILGGEEADEAVFERGIPVDVIVRKEGEVAFRDLMRLWLGRKSWPKEKLHAISNLQFKDQETIVATPIKELLTIDEIPSPYLTGVIPVHEHTYAILEITRGCPFKCSFCSEPNRYKTQKAFSLDRAFKELAFILQRTKRLQIIDNNFNIDKERIKKIGVYLDFLRKRKLVKSDFFIDVELNSSLLDKPTVGYLKKARVLAVSFGIQTLNPKSYPTLRRWKMNKEILDTKLAYFDRDFLIEMELIYGLPHDDKFSFFDSIFYIFKRFPDLRLDFNIERLKVIKNTAYRREAEEYGMVYSQKPPYALQSCNTWSNHDLQQTQSLVNYLLKDLPPENDF